MLAATLSACGASAGAATLLVGSGAPIARIADAAALARDGDIVEILPGTYRGDVAVWTQRQLTIRGVGAMPVLVADGQVAEGKAIWVVRGGDIAISNVAFEGARAADLNGAGIRFERGRLRVSRCRFTDNENGILAGNTGDAELIVEDSEFARAPRDRGPLKHLIYVGRIARFALTGSRVQQGFQGHLVKTRARENQIRYNLLDDGDGGEAAYELEFPNGGLAYVIGNVIGQSAATTNPVLIAYGAEGSAWPDSELYLSHNTLVTAPWQPAWFLRVWKDNLPPASKVVAVNNLTVGPGLFSLAARGTFSGNYPALSFALGDRGTLDFRLAGDSWLQGVDAAAPTARGESLAPTAEFKLPLGVAPLAAPERWTPGAFQSTDPRR